MQIVHNGCDSRKVVWAIPKILIALMSVLIVTSLFSRNVVQTDDMCVLVSSSYRPSKLEQMWLDNVGQFQNAYCASAGVSTTSKWVDTWINTVAQLQDQHSSPSHLDPDVFSSFRKIWKCKGEIHSETTWIEPLSHGLRHPRAPFCSDPRPADLVDRGYILLDFPQQYHQSCMNRTCQAIYLDLGASTWNAGAGGPSQSWFVNSYASHGITFDRFLLWEATPTPAAQILQDVPHHLWHKYQYFNVPATADKNDLASPVAILQQIAQPGDFVMVKLDIDNYKIESDIMRSIFDSDSVMALIDEFLFEYHVNFAPMLGPWGSAVDRSKNLSDAYELFYKLRSRGIRAHSWV